MTEAVKTYTLGGVELSVHCHDSELEQLCDWHFARLPTLPTKRGSHALSIAVRLGNESSATQPSGRPNATQRVARMQVNHGDDRLHVSHDHGGAAYASHDLIDIAIWSRPDERWLCLRQLLFMTLSWSLAMTGRPILHGALIGSGTRGVLILGNTGAGKSTFALAGLAAGLDVHSDDLVMASTSLDGQLSLRGIPKRLSVSPDGPHTQSVSPTLVPADPRGRVFLPLDRLAHGPIDEVRIAVAGHDHGSGRIERLGALDTLGSVLNSFEFASAPALLKRCFPLLARLGKQPGFTALHAAAAERRVEVAGQLLEQLLEAPS